MCLRSTKQHFIAPPHQCRRIHSRSDLGRRDCGAECLDARQPNLAFDRPIVSDSQTGVIYYSSLTLGTSDNGASGSGDASGGNLLPDPGASSTTEVITIDSSPPPDKSSENLVSGPDTPHTNGPAVPAVPSPHSAILALIGLAILCVRPRRKRALALVRVRA